ncbi:hypothetical protein C0W88_00650 [Photobacterium leiognathi subsp. mandapamensis]|uniref:DUF6236 family protein n=1 Tax=Photobacterium leiognathi TaxID=553611 RepID=UPI000D16A374|nr:DUF6236 family protein [Photobacterium leiognathi]PSW66716.1 hypothetical protein C0W88_00650 [Photobacterium leiognathi subsp. mandapamensis]
MQRGIIITPNYKVTNNGHGIHLNGGVDPIDLRKYCLLWDKIDYPVNNMIHVGGGGDIDYLMQEGMAISTEIRFREMRGDQNGIIFLATQMAAYEQACKNKNEEWSIAQPSSQLLIPDNYAKQQGCLEFELYEAIQIPTGNVSLNDVIDFKKKREPELLALRDSMDSIVDGIMASQDIPKRKNKAILKLHRDLNSFNKVMKETKFERVKRSLTTIATDPWFGVAGTGSLIKDYLPENYQSYVQGLNVAALGVCALRFGYKETFVGRDVPSEFKHFAYLSSIHRELR